MLEGGPVIPSRLERPPPDLPYPSAAAFAHRYEHLILLDTVANGGSLSDEVVPSDALSYGLELFVRREKPGLVRGWVSYTLAWARAETEAYGIGALAPGTSFPPRGAAPRLALCHLGNYCTCRKILFETPLHR